MIAALGWLVWRPIRRVGRTLRDLHGGLVQASECYWQAEKETSATIRSDGVGPLHLMATG